jgi:hypothetical protein
MISLIFNFDEKWKFYQGIDFLDNPLIFFKMEKFTMGLLDFFGFLENGKNARGGNREVFNRNESEII